MNQDYIQLNTIRDYLNFEPPLITESRDPTSTRLQLPENPREDHVSIEDWAEFSEKVTEFSNDLTKNRSDFKWSGMYERSTIIVGSETRLQARMQECIGGPLKVIMEACGIKGFFGVAGQERDFALDPDLAWMTSENYPRFLVEVKPFWKYPPDDVKANEVADLLKYYYKFAVMEWRERAADQDYDRNKFLLAEQVYFPFSQIYGYLAVNHLRYGALSTYNYTWFFERVDFHVNECSVIKISPAVPRTGLNANSMLSAWAYVICLSNDKEKYFYTSPYTTPVLKRKFAKEKYEFEHIHLSQIYFGAPISRGSVGSVVKGGYERSGTVMKLLDASKSDSELRLTKLQKEVEIYERLEDIEGKYIPSLIGAFTSQGWIYGVIFSDCGINVEALSANEFNDLEIIVKELHKLDVSHGDLEPRNILRRAGKIYVCDFTESIVRKDVDLAKWDEAVKKDLQMLSKLARIVL